MGAGIVYVLEGLTRLLCAFLLLRGYKRSGKKLLLWIGLCFAGLTATSVLIFVDLVLLPNTDLFVYRLAATAISMGILLYGFIWETQ